MSVGAVLGLLLPRGHSSVNRICVKHLCTATVHSGRGLLGVKISRVVVYTSHFC